ncbi:phosphotransferase enzyme family-domain-containing protein [Staphylotrichum tortipilum]|uniref:Phosphotransferase enzyme family-domain-containing protein n=1 Tax=Staphylotrichum tortipilum TaxID=2831512 RepID=A0AAN6RRD6_9PEZI|nr:phosphotransferase enzyme family-domain-containing protein [Staphylotrichum longicolle]
MSAGTPAQQSDFHGLAWVQEGFWDPEPRWTIEPDEKAIQQTVESALNLPASPSNTIKFLAQGAFNKVYVITLAEKEVIARVTLPVDPKWKTLSEVATLRWVCKNTSLPVPEVISYKVDRANPIGFEWIVMSKMPGKPLGEVWRDVSFSAKEATVRRLAVFCAETFRAQLRGIGNLFLGHGEEDLTSVTRSTTTGTVPGSLAQSCGSFRVGRIVSSEFNWENRIHVNVSRGPFSSSREWILARLELAEIECRRGLSHLQSKRSSMVRQPDGKDDDEKDDEKDNEKDEGDRTDDDEDELEDLTNTMTIISRLKQHVPDFFPVTVPASTPECTMILHDDLSRHNILVDDAGRLTAVVDWECISTVPFWAACQIPSLLQGKPRNEEPIKAIYHHDEDGNVAELFWEHLDEYELTRLRRLFLGEMRRLQPDWIEVFESSQRQIDFDLAVAGCSDPFMIRQILSWLDRVESGMEGLEGLEESIDSASL